MYHSNNLMNTYKSEVGMNFDDQDLYFRVIN